MFPKIESAQFLDLQLLTPCPRGSGLSCTLRPAASTEAMCLLLRPSRKSARHGPERAMAQSELRPLSQSVCSSLVYEKSRALEAKGFATFLDISVP